MKDIGKLLMNTVKESHSISDADTIFKNRLGKDELELLGIQQTYGNNFTSMILESQEDDELIKNLSLPIGEKTKDIGKSLVQLQPKQGNTVSKTYLKLGEMVLPTGLVHVGCDQEKRQIVLVTEESRKDKKKDPLHNHQKIVYNNKPVQKNENSQVGISQDWGNGAVALIDKFDKKPKKIIQTTKKIISKEEESGNLKQVLPFLDQDKELMEKKNLQQIRNQLISAQRPRANSIKAKAEIEKTIHNKNVIVDKKKSLELELSKKIEHSLKNIKTSPELLSRKDFFDLILAKRRKKTDEEEGLERNSGWMEDEKDQEKGDEGL